MSKWSSYHAVFVEGNVVNGHQDVKLDTPANLSSKSLLVEGPGFINLHSPASPFRDKPPTSPRYSSTLINIYCAPYRRLRSTGYLTNQTSASDTSPCLSDEHLSLDLERPPQKDLGRSHTFRDSTRQLRL
jgi:hypothetical protein